MYTRVFRRYSKIRQNLHHPFIIIYLNLPIHIGMDNDGSFKYWFKDARDKRRWYWLLKSRLQYPNRNIPNVPPSEPSQPSTKEEDKPPSQPSIEEKSEPKEEQFQGK